MMDDLIITRQRGTIFEILLNRPEKRNAINLDLFEQLDLAVDEAGRASDIRVILLRGQGKVFSSGIDLATFLQFPEKYGPNWRQRMRSITENFQGVLNRLERLELPTVAVLHGYCLGLSMEVALACDLRIAAEGTIFALPETRMGIIPDVGGTTRLTRLVGPARAKELIFTGRQIVAQTALNWGILNDVVSGDELLSRAEELAAEIAGSAPLAVGMVKRIIDGLEDIDRGLQLEAWAQSQLVGTEDFAEGIQSYLTKQPPAFKGK